MTALLGWWLHRLETRRTAAAGLEGRMKWLTLAPAFALIALCIGLFLWGARIVSWLGVFPQQEDLAQDMHLSYGLHLVIAVLTVLALVRWRHSKNLMKVVMGVMVADVLVFLLLSATGLIGGSDRRSHRARTPRRSWATTAAPRWSILAAPIKSSSTRSGYPT